MNIGLDNLEEITLSCEKEVTKISRLLPDGSYIDCKFSMDETGRIVIDVPAQILDPLILFLETNKSC